MANEEQLSILKQGVEVWNRWRKKKPPVKIDLPDVLVGLPGLHIWEADLSEARLVKANLSKANLSNVNLTGANFFDANLSKANLSGANLNAANLTGADLNAANLTGADLTFSDLVAANISNAKISKSNVYGVSVWDLKGEFKEQKDLIITPWNQPAITVDNIKVAQFIYLIMNN
jgi:hypothetical protein